MLQPFFMPDITEVGVDEAGRGALAGPVAAAAVVLPEKFSNTLLNDSKQTLSFQDSNYQINLFDNMRCFSYDY